MQGGTPDSSIDSQIKVIKFSDGPKKPDDSVDSDGDKQEATRSNLDL